MKVCKVYILLMLVPFCLCAQGRLMHGYLTYKQKATQAMVAPIKKDLDTKINSGYTVPKNCYNRSTVLMVTADTSGNILKADFYKRDVTGMDSLIAFISPIVMQCPPVPVKYRDEEGRLKYVDHGYISISIDGEGKIRSN